MIIRKKEEYEVMDMIEKIVKICEKAVKEDREIKVKGDKYDFYIRAGTVLIAEKDDFVVDMVEYRYVRYPKIIIHDEDLLKLKK